MPHPRLVQTDHGLGLVDDDAPDLSALVIDLSRPRRLTQRDDLVRALGWAKGLRRVVDATGGLGRDAAAIAAYGFDVVVCERAPLMVALWRDALARHQPERLRFVDVDAVAYLGGVSDDNAPDVVFVDPMYPGGPRKALQQRELRLIAAAVAFEGGNGHDDGGALIDAACAAACARVVAKRPKWASPLKPSPIHTWMGASTCFDLFASTRRAATQTG
jgi:16S rRNA (guanine1516-N2)-methyltransferase